MPPFTSEQFHGITRANPECVWDALTATGVPLDYLHGMTADSDWQPSARVTLALAGQWRLTGEVLAAERHTDCPTPSTTHPAHHRCTSPGSYAAPVMGRSSTSTLTSPGRSRAAPKTSKAPGFPCSPAWSNTLNGARLRPQTRQGETGRRAAAGQGPAPAGTRDTPADRPG